MLSLDNNFYNFFESSLYNLGVFEKILFDKYGNYKNNIYDNFTIASFFYINGNNSEKTIIDIDFYRSIANVHLDSTLISRDSELSRICSAIKRINSLKFANKNTYFKIKDYSYKKPYDQLG